MLIFQYSRWQYELSWSANRQYTRRRQKKHLFMFTTVQSVSAPVQNTSMESTLLLSLSCYFGDTGHLLSFPLCSHVVLVQMLGLNIIQSSQLRCLGAVHACPPASTPLVDHAQAHIPFRRPFSSGLRHGSPSAWHTCVHTNKLHLWVKCAQAPDPDEKMFFDRQKLTGWEDDKRIKIHPGIWRSQGCCWKESNWSQMTSQTLSPNILQPPKSHWQAYAPHQPTDAHLSRLPILRQHYTHLNTLSTDQLPSPSEPQSPNLEALVLLQASTGETWGLSSPSPASNEQIQCALLWTWSLAK